MVAEMLQKLKFMLCENVFSFNKNTFVFNKICSHYITFFFKISNTFSFNQNKFVVSKKYFYHTNFFCSSKIYFYHMNFSFNAFLVSISGLPFLCIKVRIFLSACKSNNSTRMWILINSFMAEVSGFYMIGTSVMKESNIEHLAKSW